MRVAQSPGSTSASASVDGGRHETATALDLAGYDRNLRKTAPPLLEAVTPDKRPALEAVTPDKRAALEALPYGNAYKGVTDFVTQWRWHRHAQRVVRPSAAGPGDKLCQRLESVA